MSVLIIKLGALGDLIMATSAISQIQEHHAPTRTALLTSDTYMELFRNWQGLEVIGFPRHGWRTALRMLRWIRARGFQRIYDLQSNDRTSILCVLSGVTQRVGNHPRYPYTHHPDTAYRGQCHIYDRMQEVLHSAGVRVAPRPPGLPLGDLERERVRQWLASRALLDKPFVLLHAGSSANRPEKRWPGFRALAVALRANGLHVVYIGGAADTELNRSLVSQPDIDASGCFSVLELVALAAHARFAVTGDSGPMHVLASAGLPVYGLFGTSSTRRNHPVGQAHNVITAAQTGRTPLALLPVERVLEKLRSDGLLH